MKRIWLVWIFLVLATAALYFFAGQWHIGWRAILLLFVAVVIILAVRKRRGELQPYPAYLRALPLRRIILIGVGLILASFAWLIFGFLFFNLQNAQNAYAIVGPFAALLIAGLAMAGGGLGIKLGKLMWEKL